MNILEVNLESTKSDKNKWIILIDGVEFLELVRDVEKMVSLQTNEPHLAGSYGYLVRADIHNLAKYLLRHPPWSSDEKTQLLECECGCWGCWPLLVDIVVLEDVVIWKAFENEFRKTEPNKWNYPESFVFKFDRKQYETALQNAMNTGTI